MKRIETLMAVVTLMLNLGAASAYAQQIPVNMTVSGTAANSTVNLGTSGPTSEYNFGGNGMFGPFTLRVVSAGPASPGQNSACPSPKLYFPVTAGAGVFRFQDGSLLKVHLTGGGDCIDLVVGQALCIRIFQVTGGTGRFQGASGAVTLTETVVPLPMLPDPFNPVFFTATGDIVGAISAPGPGQGQQ